MGPLAEAIGVNHWLEPLDGEPPLVGPLLEPPLEPPLDPLIEATSHWWGRQEHFKNLTTGLHNRYRIALAPHF